MSSLKQYLNLKEFNLSRLLAGLALFIPYTRDSIFSRAISKNVSNMIYTKSKIKKCEYKEWIVKNPFYDSNILIRS